MKRAMDAVAALLGPALALLVGVAGWATARRWAPLAAANDNMPRRLAGGTAVRTAGPTTASVIGLTAPNLAIVPSAANDAPLPPIDSSDAAG